ncbi:MAG: hypothetical protein JW708_04730 [Vallitaleaceae bacterium]|nr:hypothetical protein [Vallitaleaceae bacterium]
MIVQNQMTKNIQQIQSTSTNHVAKSVSKQNQIGANSFQGILNQQLQQNLTSELRFSKHASMRLESRDINLNQEQLQRIQQGLESARSKGIKESLMVMDNIALVVNVDHSTVITALETKDTINHVFTNIDGAVFV